MISYQTIIIYHSQIPCEVSRILQVGRKPCGFLASILGAFAASDLTGDSATAGDCISLSSVADGTRCVVII